MPDAILHAWGHAGRLQLTTVIVGNFGRLRTPVTSMTQFCKQGIFFKDICTEIVFMTDQEQIQAPTPKTNF